MDPSHELEQLRDLLLAPEVTTLQALEGQLASLQRQIRDPEQFAQLLQPVLADMVRRADPALSLALVHALAPLLDRAVRENIRVDAGSLASALAPTSTGAIARHYAEEPEAASTDLAPLVSAAIKEQVRGERDAMIDALYPVIGATISKYLSETLSALVRQMNAKIEDHVSLRSLLRKLRSRLTGVSEAELLLRESLPVRVDAAFLIHTESGLVIAQAQNPDTPPLDPDLLSGMLTAIRSLFNDSMDRGEQARELDQITYGESTILLEVGGYCYLAVVVRGIPDDPLRRRLRETLSRIVQVPGRALESFDGDSSSLPQPIVRLVHSLVGTPSDQGRPLPHRPPYGVLALAGVVALAIGIPLGLFLYNDSIDNRKAEEIQSALQTSHPSFAHGISVDVDRSTVRLAGIGANVYQRDAAERSVLQMIPEAEIENTMVIPPPPPFAALVGRQVESLAGALSTMTGVYVDAFHADGAVTLTGIAPDAETVRGVTEAFAGLPGLRALENRLVYRNAEIGGRVLFDRGSALLRPEFREHLEHAAEALRQTPWARLLVVGYCDSTGEQSVNERLALDRANAVRAGLREHGVDTSRITVRGHAGPPQEGSVPLSDSLSRCAAIALVPLGSGDRP